MRRTFIMILRLTAVAGAAVLFAGTATAQNVVRTETRGGDGGAPFDDSPSDIKARGRISTIVVRHADHVDGIGVGYASGAYVYHGGNGGNETTIRLKPDEFITSVAGQNGIWIDQITFYSNKIDPKTKRQIQYGPYGRGGSNYFSYDFKGKALLYLIGRSGRFVDQIGFGYGDLPPALPTTITRSLPRGGTGGDLFDDLNAGFVPGQIQSITVRHGDEIDRIKVKYKDGPEVSHGSDRWGNDATPFVLDDDEWLTEVKGKARGDHVMQMQFVTNKRYSPVYGANDGQPFTFKRKGCVIKAFFGHAGRLIDQLGVYYENARPLAIEILDVKYDFDKSQILMAPPLALMSVNLENKTSINQTLSQAVQVTTTDTSTMSTTDMVEAGVTVKVAKDYVVTKAELTFSFKYAHTMMTGSTHSDTHQQTYTFNASVPPQQTVTATCIAIQKTFDVPWTATAKITYQGKDPVTKILHGTLKGVQTTHLQARYESPPLEGTVVSNDGNKLVVSTQSGQNGPKQQVLSLAKETTATVDSKQSKVAALKPGTKVRVFAKANARTTASRVEALHQHQKFEKSLIEAPRPPARGNAYDAKLVRETGNQLVVSDLNGKNAHTVTLAKDARVTLDGRVCRLTDLRPGMRIHVSTRIMRPGEQGTPTATLVEAVRK